MDEFRGTTSMYELLDRVGEGTFGVVRCAVDKKTRQEVAIKQIVKVFDDRRMTRRVLRELRVLHRFRHKNIINLLDATSSRGAVYVVTDLSRIDLFHLIHNNKELYKTLAEEDFTHIMKQILEALEFLHLNGILHRDIKPSNILLNEKMTIHLCDFGLCRKLATISQATAAGAGTIAGAALGDGVSFEPRGLASILSDLSLDSLCDLAPMTDYVVTRWYRAPEVCLSEGFYDTSQDIWSAGCTLTELITRRVLFPGNSTRKQLELMVATVGHPKDIDLTFPIIPRAKAYLDSMERTDGKHLQDIIPATRVMNGANRDNVIQMLQGMLEFSPRLRLTASACLMSKVFRDKAAGSPVGVSEEPAEKAPFVQVDCSFDDIESNEPAAQRNLGNLLMQELERIQEDIRAGSPGLGGGGSKETKGGAHESSGNELSDLCSPLPGSSTSAASKSLTVSHGESSVMSQLSSSCRSMIKSKKGAAGASKIPTDEHPGTDKYDMERSSSLNNLGNLSRSSNYGSEGLGKEVVVGKIKERRKSLSAVSSSFRVSIGKMLGLVSRDAMEKGKVLID